MSVKLRFRHIEGFRAVMQTGTATGAASMLNVTQPAVSQLMTELEAAVGFALFDRRGGRLEPTPNANLMFDEIERCFTGLDHVNAFCARLKTSSARAIVLGAAPSMVLSLLPAAVGRYVADVAKDFFTLFPRHSNESIRLVGSRKVDIGFGSTPASLPGIHCEPISTHQAICVLPLDHPLATRAHIEAIDLQNQPFITMSRTEGVHAVVDDIFRRQNIEVANVAECTMTTAACALVENGVGITLADPVGASFFVGRRVALRRFVPAAPVTFYGYWLDGVAPHFRRDAFIEILKMQARRMEADLDSHLGAAAPSASAAWCPIDPAREGGRKSRPRG